jgi:hypothetical protein
MGVITVSSLVAGYRQNGAHLDCARILILCLSLSPVDVRRCAVALRYWS